VVNCINIPHNEAAIITGDYTPLEARLYALLYADLQRVLEHFFLDLFAEIARKERGVLSSNKTVTFEEIVKAPDALELLLEKQLMSLSHSDRDGFEKYFEGMGLPILQSAGIEPGDREFLAREFRLLWGVRNLLQHNHGIVNELFLKKNPDSGYAAGDRVVIDIPKLGRALGAVERIANDRNRRAVAK
jgi:hypothetical protein